ncbi:MAG TPA: carboxypeptidase-like regulatory domain-containing protein [Longimicrobiaceae bacterium]|nr:carboxypeptidase-like regulatory domain-containing protein [Longimicrobiaceae bacterium]
MLAVAYFSLAGCDDPSPIDPIDGPGNVSGTVALAKTAAGVPNAIIALLSDGDVVRTTATNTTGEFSFAQVPPGEYIARLIAMELTGLDPRYVSFAPLEVPISVGDAPVEVFYAGNGLVPPHIVGDVFCGGVPVVGAEARVVGGDFDTTVATNDQGRFSATNLAAGNYTVLLVSESSSCEFEPFYRVVEMRAGQGASVEFGAP